MQQTNGHPKYPNLTKVIKMALIFPLGNADVERGLSVNNSVVTTERSLLIESAINGLRNTKYIVKFSDPEKNRPEKLPLTKKVMSAAVNAHAEYMKRLEMDKEREEEEKRERERRKAENELREKEREQLLAQRSTLQQEAKLAVNEKKANDALASAYQLLKEGNEKLRKALERGDLQSAATAQLMIDTETQKKGEHTIFE